MKKVNRADTVRVTRSVGVRVRKREGERGKAR